MYIVIVVVVDVIGIIVIVIIGSLIVASTTSFRVQSFRLTILIIVVLVVIDVAIVYCTTNDRTIRIPCAACCRGGGSALLFASHGLIYHCYSGITASDAHRSR